MSIRSISFGLPTGVLLSMLLFAGQAMAFCVHNDSDVKMEFGEQTNCSYFGCYDQWNGPAHGGPKVLPPVCPK